MNKKAIKVRLLCDQWCLHKQPHHHSTTHFSQFLCVVCGYLSPSLSAHTRTHNSQTSSFQFANAVRLSREQAEGIWDALRKAIEEIQEGNASKLRFEELYRFSRRQGKRLVSPWSYHVHRFR